MYMVEEFLESLVSDATRKSYRRGLMKFEEYYGKEAKFLLRDKDPSKIIERFYVWLRKKYSQNSCRALTNPIIQYCKYNRVQLNIKKSLGIYATTETTRDHILSVDEAREMYKVDSLEKKVMVKIWLLGLRIGDASRLQYKWFNVIPSENLVEILVHTRKEGIVAHCFIDPESQRLLAKHIPNLDQNNPYLFQSEKGGHIKEKQLLRRLQSLQKKAHIKARGSFGWHIARKLFMRTCAENGVISWNAQLMVGKSVDKSIKTYINHASLRKDAEKVLRVLQMEEVKEASGISNLEEAINIFGQILARVVIQNMKPEDLERLGLDVQRLLSSETPIENLKAVLDYMKRREEDYEVQSKRGREDYYRKR